MCLRHRSNERSADHRKHRSSIVARVRFRGNVFTEPLPSNELFRHNIMLLGFYFERQSETVSKRYDSGHITYIINVTMANRQPFPDKIKFAYKAYSI
jgi:hypothetical protein